MGLHPTFYLGAEDLDSDPPACTASTPSAVSHLSRPIVFTHCKDSKLASLPLAPQPFTAVILCVLLSFLSLHKCLSKIQYGFPNKTDMECIPWTMGFTLIYLKASTMIWHNSDLSVPSMLHGIGV